MRFLVAIALVIGGCRPVPDDVDPDLVGDSAIMKTWRSLDALRREAAAYNRLRDQGAQLWVGNRCGVAGGPAAGRDDLLLLASAGRKDLLRDLLTQEHPATKVYALIGLSSLGELTRAQALEAASLVNDVPACAGCFVWWDDGRTALEAYWQDPPR